jgi:hypothetical protein
VLFFGISEEDDVLIPPETNRTLIMKLVTTALKNNTHFTLERYLLNGLNGRPEYTDFKTRQRLERAQRPPLVIYVFFVTKPVDLDVQGSEAWQKHMACLASECFILFLGVSDSLTIGYIENSPFVTHYTPSQFTLLILPRPPVQSVVVFDDPAVSSLRQALQRAYPLFGSPRFRLFSWVWIGLLSGVLIVTLIVAIILFVRRALVRKRAI